MEQQLPAIEVETRDRPGLLYDLARTLTANGISISSAIIATYGEQAVDAFHEGRLSFLGIVDTVERVDDAHEAPAEHTRESLSDAEAWARRTADALIVRA